MKRDVVSAIATLALASTAALAADRAPQGTGQPQTTGKPSGSEAQQDVTVQPTMTLVGCVYREDQVPERKPNIAERAGILEDYILAGATTTTAESRSGAAA